MDAPNLDLLLAQCAPQVAVSTMRAIVKTESAGAPYAININGEYVLERQPRNKEEALATARVLVQNQIDFDLGIGQINYRNFKRLGVDIEAMLDPCTNIQAAGKLLYWNYLTAKRSVQDEQLALRSAISMYNTGNTRSGFSNGYVAKVVNNALTNSSGAAPGGVSAISYKLRGHGVPAPRVSRPIMSAADATKEATHVVTLEKDPVMGY